MKRISVLWALLLSLLVSVPAYAEGLLAFPGAEGFGRFATGGRGGTIYHVTNLNDSGTGSFRDAVSKPNRIIVFDVSGVIHLESALVFSSDLTVLGQTAPGEGVQVYGERVSFSGANNIIVRYMRFRMGVGGSSGKDACGVSNGKNMIFDHLSALWGRDECFSISWDNKGTMPSDITIQNSIIGQGLQSHSCGGLIQTEGGVTLYRNLYIENKTRNPKVKGLNQFVNNVVYNWGGGGCYIMGDSEGPSWAHIENNYFMKGPWNGTAPFTRGNSNFKYYAAGNYYDTNKDGVANGREVTEAEYTSSGSSRVYDLETFDGITTRPKAHPTIVGMMSAEEALRWIIDSVGPCLPVRDEVDQYLIDELTSFGTKGSTNGISSEKELPHGGTGTLYGGNKPLDSDGDGIPDEWEIANGLNPNDASDAAAIAANGYANIENYVFTITSAYPYVKAPSNLMATEQKKESISLSWTDNADDESGFIIEVSTDNQSFIEAGRVGADVVTYTATSLTPETAYYFRVKAYNGDGVESVYTATLATETIGDPSAPLLSVNPAPAVDAEVGAANAVVFSWENATKPYYGQVTYAVYAGTSADNLQSLATGLTSTTYNYGRVVAGTTYYWRVDATNDEGTTIGTVWTFKAVEGGILFYTDFNTQPDAWNSAYGSIADNTNVINGANTSKTVGGMKFGSGSNSIRVVAMSAANNSADMSKDYGPATEADAGATDRCVQFYTTSSGGYLQLPQVSGPCIITIWAGNPETKSKTFKLNTIVDGVENNVASFTLGNKKRIYKFQYIHMDDSKVTFKIDANAIKFNINDILIEQYIPEVVTDPIAVEAWPDTAAISYADGAMTFTFNQVVMYHGGAVFSGEQYENVEVSASGTSLTLKYSALDVNTSYTLSFPEGALTDYNGEKTFTGELFFSTCDFPVAKSEGETHYGKAAASLPLDFAPFTQVAPFTTVGGLVQTSQNDYPHWVQVSGEIGENVAVMNKTSDKIMTYFDGRSAALDLSVDYSGGGSVEFKIQESRNCDITPGWRTIRILTADDFPFDGQLLLNAETRFVKISVPTLTSGELTVSRFRIADAEGRFDLSGGVSVNEQEENKVVLLVSREAVTLNGVEAGARIEVFSLTGVRVYEAVATESSHRIALPSGYYLIRIGGNEVHEVIL